MTERRAAARRQARRLADPDALDEALQFAVVVESLLDDPEWRRRIRLVQLRHRVGRAGSWILRGFAELGWWFTVVGPQRCDGPGARPPGHTSDV
jgi:hypothetical protein